MSLEELTSSVAFLETQISEGEQNDDTKTNLNELLNSCIRINDLVKMTDVSTTHEMFQKAVQTCIKGVEKCTHMVNMLDMFSSNEHVSEIAPGDIRFLILPAMLGTLTSMLADVELAKRLKNLEISEVYFRDFLLRCQNYEIPSLSLKHFEESIKDTEELSSPAEDPTSTRERRIHDYNHKKKLQQKKKAFEDALGQRSDDYLREYSLTIVEIWILLSIEELEMIQREKLIMKSCKTNGHVPGRRPKEPAKCQPLKPMIITRNEVQKRVFGLGYPSIPVLTIDDFYLQRFGDAFKNQQTASAAAGSSLQDMALSGQDHVSQAEAEEVEKEELLEKDDAAALQNARDWDAWKDENRRGSGNRHNKG